jgi:ferredoxin-NADP reductase
VARAAVPGRLSSQPSPWLVATVAETRDETATARTIAFDAPGWPGHQPGQHVTVRLTAGDGYSTQRDYSIASAPYPAGDAGAERLEITVQRLEDGEVSPYLTEIAEPGDQLELRGPIGGWFTWPQADPRPLLLLAGGSGVVPLMSMIRTHTQVKSQAPLRLIYSARTPADVIYADELSERVRVSSLAVTYLYTRGNPAAPPAPKPPLAQGAVLLRAPEVHTGRLNPSVLAEAAFPPSWNPLIFICGPSGFVEAASALLIAAGHPPFTIKTERFGPS